MSLFPHTIDRLRAIQVDLNNQIDGVDHVGPLSKNNERRVAWTITDIDVLIKSLEIIT